MASLQLHARPHPNQTPEKMQNEPNAKACNLIHHTLERPLPAEHSPIS